VAAFLLVVAIGCFPGRPACAQETPNEVIVLPGVPGATVSVPVPTANIAKPADAAPKTAEEKRLDELLKLKFDRTPASILQAQTVLATDTLPSDKPLERFRLNVVAGRWKEVGLFLKTLSEKDAIKVYEYLLKDLDRVPAAVPVPGQQPGPAPSTTLLQLDIAELADIAPAALTENQLKLLGALLTRVVAANSFLEPLLKRLKRGPPNSAG
jgi:hypothetical protein